VEIKEHNLTFRKAFKKPISWQLLLASTQYTT
jgi:hypothetical protein